MSEFKKGISNEETRKLKEWEPGRYAQLKLWIKHLETAFDFNSLATPVLQSPKRLFSEFVPKVVPQDIITEVEYQEVRVAWAHPRGLKFLLFYEIQISEFPNFAQFDTFITYDPFYVFVNLANGVTYYFRLRVVTKDGLFGPWSDTVAVTLPFTQGFGFFDGQEYETAIISGDQFNRIFNQTYNAIGGSIIYSICYEVENFAVPLETRPSQFDCEFRWVVDDEQIGQIFYTTTFGSDILGEDINVRTADIGGPGDSLILPSPFFLDRRGTFRQKLHTITPGTHEISLEARLPITNLDRFYRPVSGMHPTPNDWIVVSGGPFVYGNEGNLGYPETAARIRLKNFSIFEVLVDDFTNESGQ